MELSLDKFGRFLMENLRDKAIDNYDHLAAGQWKTPALQKLQAELAILPPQTRDLIRRCVRDSIDVGIHDFLFKLQEREDFDKDIQILVDGKNIVTLSDGIHGESYGKDGWQNRFSKYGENHEE